MIEKRSAKLSSFAGAGPAFKWTVPSGSESVPLYRITSDYLRISEEEARSLIEFGSVYVSGRVSLDPETHLSGGEPIEVNYPRYGTKRFYELAPERILYRDRYLLGYDKEAGIPSQQAPYDAYNNVYAALLRMLNAEKKGPPYAALHHRLDRETSGVILFVLDPRVNRAIGKAFERHEVGKQYLAWVEGRPQSDRWEVDLDIGRAGGKHRAVPRGSGKSAKTIFHLLTETKDRSLVLAQPLTGRTHQIRLHLSAGGNPIAGDVLYGGKPAARLYLHAFRLRLKHPVSKTGLEITAPLPQNWPPPHDVRR